MLRRRFALGTLACAACAALLPATLVPTGPARADDAHAVPKTSLTADQALARLMEGNRRFVADDPMRPPINSGRRHELAGGQGPFAAIVGCSDSRVAPETLFGAGLGEVFTIRVAGNTVPASGLSSLAYSVMALGAPLMMVLGHERCGAVGAAVDFVTKNQRLPDPMMAMVEPIVPAVRAAQRDGGDQFDAAVKQNARATAATLAAHPAFAPRVAAGTLMVVAARYDLDDGKVELV